MEMKKDESFWRNIISLVEQGKRISFLMKEYHFTRTSYYYWKKKLCKTKEEIKEDENNKLIKQLQREKAELEIENEILKKAISIIGKR